MTFWARLAGAYDTWKRYDLDYDVWKHCDLEYDMWKRYDLEYDMWKRYDLEYDMWKRYDLEDPFALYHPKHYFRIGQKHAIGVLPAQEFFINPVMLRYIGEIFANGTSPPLPVISI